MYNMVTGSIVTYNNISTIAKTLETLFDETQNVDFKLYVVDNGSQDGTPEYIEKNFSQVSVIRSEKNVGFVQTVSLQSCFVRNKCPWEQSLQCLLFAAVCCGQSKSRLPK